MIGGRVAAGAVPPVLVMVGVLIATSLPSAAPAGGNAANCAVPAELMAVDADARLPHLAARMHAGLPVRIVAIGGASTAGAAAGSPDLAYPHQLQEALADGYAAPVTVVNKGLPHQSAQQMLLRFPSAVFAEHPVMVIWETGATDAVRGIDVDEFAATLQTGIDELEARSIDVVLMDMQFSPRIMGVVDFDSYLRAIYRVGDLNDLYVFPRYEIMRYWSEQNLFRFDALARADRTNLAAKVYRCLGHALAAAIRTVLQ